MELFSVFGLFLFRRLIYNELVHNMTKPLAIVSKIFYDNSAAHGD